MKRYSVDRRQDRKVFTRTAEKLHWANFMFITPMRGGKRL